MIKDITKDRDEEEQNIPTLSEDSPPGTSTCPAIQKLYRA
jgi:hypothetical protein